MFRVRYELPNTEPGVMREALIEAKRGGVAAQGVRRMHPQALIMDIKPLDRMMQKLWRVLSDLMDDRVAASDAFVKLKARGN